MELTIQERLVVGLDFEIPKSGPENLESKAVYVMGARRAARARIIDFARKLSQSADTRGIVLKINADLRALGYDLLQELHDLGFKTFADLKLSDIPKTLERDAVFLQEARPAIVTVMANAGAASIEALKAGLPDTEVLAVTVLTSMTRDDVGEIYNRNYLEDTVADLVKTAQRAGADGIVCAPAQIRIVENTLHRPMSIVTPGIRFPDETIMADNQNRSQTDTPAGALARGAHRIVMARPIINAADPIVAVERALQGIVAGLEARAMVTR